MNAEGSMLTEKTHRTCQKGGAVLIKTGSIWLVYHSVLSWHKCGRDIVNHIHKIWIWYGSQWLDARNFPKSITILIEIGNCIFINRYGGHFNTSPYICIWNSSFVGQLKKTTVKISLNEYYNNIWNPCQPK